MHGLHNSKLPIYIIRIYVIRNIIEVKIEANSDKNNTHCQCDNARYTNQSAQVCVYYSEASHLYSIYVVTYFMCQCAAGYLVYSYSHTKVIKLIMHGFSFILNITLVGQLEGWLYLIIYIQLQCIYVHTYIQCIYDICVLQVLRSKDPTMIQNLFRCVTTSQQNV